MRMSIILVSLIFLSSAVLAWTEFTGTVTLTDKTVYEDINFKVDHDARVIVLTVPRSGQKRIVSFDDIASITDEQGHDITTYARTPRSAETADETDAPPAVDSALIPRKPDTDSPAADSSKINVSLDESWIEQQDPNTVDQRRIDAAYDSKLIHSGKQEPKPRTFKMLFRIGGLYSFPGGWNDMIQSAAGFDGQVIVGLNNRLGIGLDASHVQYDLDDDFFIVTTSANLTVEDKRARVHMSNFMLSFGGFWPLIADDTHRTIAFAELKFGVYYRKLIMEADLRDINTNQPLHVSWNENATEGALKFSGGLIQSLSSRLAVSVSGSFNTPILEPEFVPEDIPFEYIPPRQNKPDDSSFNLHLSLVVMIL